MYEQNMKMCWICNTKSRTDFIRFNKDGSVTWTDKCINPNCPTHNRFITG